MSYIQELKVTMTTAFDEVHDIQRLLQAIDTELDKQANEIGKAET